MNDKGFKTAVIILLCITGLIVAMFVVDIAGKWGQIAAMEEILHRGEVENYTPIYHPNTPIGKGGELMMKSGNSCALGGCGKITMYSYEYCAKHPELACHNK